MAMRVSKFRCVCAALFFGMLSGCEPLLAATLNDVMASIGREMVQLYPIIVANRPLTPEDKKAVVRHVDRLAELFTNAQTFIAQRSETYQVSYALVSDHLADVQRVIGSGDVERARFDLYKLGPICTSCHTQDTRLRTLFSGTGRSSFPDDRSFAEFNYLTRNYAEAEQYFDRYLKSDVERSEFDLMQPLQRIVTIYAQVFNRPLEGAQKLRRYLHAKGHSEYTLKYLRGWIDGLEKLAQDGAQAMIRPDLKAIEAAIEKYIGSLDQTQPVTIEPLQQVQRVWLRGRLYHYLNTAPAREAVPRVLYWLAVSDRAIGYDYYFSLADLYLKDCVFSYPSHPYAQRCFKAYRDYVTDLYAGPGGSYLPAEVSADLMRMETALKDGRSTR